VSTVSPASRHDLTAAQWAVLVPLLPPPTGRGRPRRYPLRGLVDGARYRARVGCPWRDVPDRYGPWWRVYALFACWQVLGCGNGSSPRLIGAADAQGKLSWQASVDSTTARAHVHAAGARRDSVNLVAGEPGHHALGRSRGGWSTKTHLAVDQRRGVISFLLTPGQAGESPQMIGVLERIRVMRPGGRRARTRPDRVLADKAYSSRANRAWLAGTASARPSRSQPTKPRTARLEAAAAADHPRSIRKHTRTGTPSNAASTRSNTTAASPLATTNSPSATPRPYTSPSSTTGFDDLRNRP
jgi:transposase